MSEKYMRDKLTLPVRMVKELCADLRSKRAPPAKKAPPKSPRSSSGSSSSSSSSSDSEASSGQETVPSFVFYVKKDRDGKTLPTYRHHVDAELDPLRWACTREPFDPSRVLLVGARPPPGSVVCTKCIGARPEIAVKVLRWKLNAC
jgi:hypothetical protein